jgi:hypothetical protein
LGAAAACPPRASACAEAATESLSATGSGPGLGGASDSEPRVGGNGGWPGTLSMAPGGPGHWQLPEWALAAPRLAAARPH